MSVLIIGNDGREYALAWKVVQDPRVMRALVALGNADIAIETKCKNVVIDMLALERLADFAARSVQLTFVGPEAPLVASAVDLFRERGLDIFGPAAGATQLEGSKTFTKDFLTRHRISTAAYHNFIEVEPALAYLHKQGAPIVVKADGLAAGKGVIAAMNLDETEAAVRDMLAGNTFGDADSRVVIEEFLDGEEVSFIVMVDDQNMLLMATSQDHKRVGDDDSGPNTGGMGAYSPAPVVTAEVHQRVLDEVIYPTVRDMAEKDNVYTGLLYVGLMINKSGAPRAIELNRRFGDPETQPVMVHLESSLVLLVETTLAKALDKVKVTWDPRPTVGVVLAADGYPGDYAKGEIIEGLAEAAALGGKMFHADTALRGSQMVASGGRVLCATAVGESVSATQQQAYHLAKGIRWNDYFYRKDIGYRVTARERSES